MNVIKNKYKALTTKINNQIIKATRTNQKLITREIKKLINAGGKRIRPMLMIKVAELGEMKEKKKIEIGAALEILHMATLVHDDIIDEARIRRNILTIQNKFGKDTAVFVGDFLLSRSYRLFCNNISGISFKRLNKTVNWICLGETNQYLNRYDLESISIKKYLRRIRRKTAIFISFCTYLGGFESGQRGLPLYHLYKFGMELGMAFQIQDDLIDFTGDSEDIGKAVGQDLTSGIYTLPIILMLQDKEVSKKIKIILNQNSLTETNLSYITSLINNNNYLEKSKKLQNNFLQRSRKHLNFFPESNIKRELNTLLDFNYYR